MSFADCEKLTRQIEGGWYDGSESHDSNPTMWGVTQNTYTRYRERLGLALQTVARMTPAECTAIYRQFWDDAHAELVGPKTAFGYFDHALNAGPGQAVKALQHALGVESDGVIGPKTKAAIQGADDATLAALLGYERLKWYAALAVQLKHRPSLLSWVNRSLACRQAAL